MQKYSSPLRSAIAAFDCRILVCGMKVETTTENRERIDSKCPVYGLDLPEDRSIHLRGLSWPLELEILTRCNVCVVHPSRFSEALYIRRERETSDAIFLGTITLPACSTCGAAHIPKVIFLALSEKLLKTSPPMPALTPHYFRKCPLAPEHGCRKATSSTK